LASWVLAIAVNGFALEAKTQVEIGTSAPGTLHLNSAPAPRPSLSMIINLRNQRAYVYRGGLLIHATPISSGKLGYRTPTGTFTVVEKQKVHHSNKYDNAPMPYMQRLTWYGLALHGGHVPGYPASHGCIRLPLGFARWLYGEPTMGMTVVITNQRRSERLAENSGSAGASADMDEEDTTGSR
jgi:lipoprotein-anchoring transpeptidase ErfK/SrfK